MSQFFKCENCNQTGWWDDLHLSDQGGYEEFWGARVWRSEYEASCPACGGTDITEITEEEYENGD